MADGQSVQNIIYGKVALAIYKIPVEKAAKSPPMRGAQQMVEPEVLCAHIGCVQGQKPVMQFMRIFGADRHGAYRI